MLRLRAEGGFKSAGRESIRYFGGLAFLSVASAAWGQQNASSLSVSQSVGYESNVFQVANGEPKTNDFVASTGIAVDVNKVVDIYSFSLNASAQSNTYQDTKVLNNPSYILRLGAASNAERLSASLQVLATQSLGDYATPNVERTFEKNIQNTELIGLGVRYASTPRVDIGGGFAYQWNNFSAAAFESQESSQGAVFLDLSYRVTPVLQIGFGPRFTKGVTPKYGLSPTAESFVADDFDGKYLDLLMAWNLSTDSNLTAGMSLTRVTHTVATQMDYSGLTGFANWSYRLGGKLSMNASIAQATGLGDLSGGASSPFPLGGVATTSAAAAGSIGTGPSASGGSTAPAGGGAGAALAGPGGGAPSPQSGGANSNNNNRLNRTASFGAQYALGGRTTVTTALTFNNGSFSDSNGTPGSARTTTFDLGILYVPMPALSISCSLNLSYQNANQSAVSSGQAHSYKASTTGCTVQYTLQ